MRSRSVCVLIGVAMSGCNPIEQAGREAERQQAVADNLEQIDEDLRQLSAAKKTAPPTECTHRITTETEYYTTGPQQGRPSDGKLAVDTAVKIIRPSGSYALVETQDGLRAYVASDALQPR